MTTIRYEPNCYKSVSVIPRVAPQGMKTAAGAGTLMEEPAHVPEPMDPYQAAPLVQVGMG